MNENLKQILTVFLESVVIDKWKFRNADFSQQDTVTVTLQNENTGGTVSFILSEERTGASRYFAVNQVPDSTSDSQTAGKIGNELTKLLRQFEKNNLILFTKPDAVSLAPEKMTPSKIDERVVMISPTQKVINLNIILSGKCPWRCCFCHMWKANEILDDIDEPGLLDEVSARVDHYGHDNLRNINFTGAEPLEHKYILDLIPYITRNFRRLEIYTTGMRLLDADFVEKVKDFNITYVIPLYGATAAVHDFVTGIDGSFDRAMEVINNCPLRINVHTLILKANLGYLNQIKELCASSHKSHRFNLMHLVPGMEDKYAENAPRLTDVVRELKDALSEREYREFIKNNKRKLPFCIIGKKCRMEAIEIRCRSMDGTEELGPVVQNSMINPEMIDCRYRGACAYGNECPGIFKIYTEIYGWGEFQPISKE
ncbi:MAG: radical SAM protein [bacterium]